MISKTFLLAGDAIFTIELPAELAAKHAPHYTFRVQKVLANERWPDGWFVQLLTGPNNQADYARLGKLDDWSGHVKAVKGACCGEDAFPFRLLNRVLCRIWGDEGAVVEEAGYRVHHEGRCGRCGNPLTVPASVESGFGPECRKILGIETPAAKPAARKPRKAKAAHEPVEVFEASDRPDLSDCGSMTPTYDAEGELMWWSGVQADGREVTVFND